jgi:hypothetical protein
MANAQPQVPQFPQDSRHRVPSGRLLPVAFGKEKQVNIRMGEEFPATIAAQGKQAEVFWFIKLRGKEPAVKPGNHSIHRLRALAQHGQAIACAIKL